VHLHRIELHRIAVRAVAEVVLRRGERDVAEILRNIWTDDEGQDIAEYAVMLAVMLAISIGTIKLIGANANNMFSGVASQLSH